MVTWRIKPYDALINVGSTDVVVHAAV